LSWCAKQVAYGDLQITSSTSKRSIKIFIKIFQNVFLKSDGGCFIFLAAEYWSLNYLFLAAESWGLNYLFLAAESS